MVVMVLAAREVDAALECTIGRTLVANGFEALSSRRWVRGAKAPFRHIFDVEALKGNGFSLRWAFSLDYVPHLAGNRVRWHKTNKSSRIDLCFDPLDFAPDPPPILSASSLSADFEHAATRLFSRALPSAEHFWLSYSSMEGIRKACEMLKGLPARRFHFYNYISHPLTLAFTLRKLGDLSNAQVEFERFVADSQERKETLLELRSVFENESRSAA